ncbi:dihydrofolate reductase [Pseudogemmobacter sp. W21_MBD1_M6]|uniref:dihydrofolate reductase n=1 Tax=Pseudogemmobacter sp. W21_MBD1_M6 TaxID=3240271 RepID=UPI003F97EC08
MITLIVARARNNAIGRNGDIPWDVPEDLRMFWRETTQGALIMGRRTWESLPVKPLKGRFNCVVTRGDVPADAVCRSVDEAINACYAAGYSRIYGIGGQAIYQALLPRAHRLLITEVDLDVPDADTWFPDFNEQDWTTVHTRTLREDGPRCVLKERLVKAG